MVKDGIRRRNFRVINLDVSGTFTGGMTMQKLDTRVWYVDSGKTSPAVSGDGKTWEQAVLTLQEAVTLAGDYDTILIAPNTIETIAATGIAITKPART